MAARLGLLFPAAALAALARASAAAPAVRIVSPAQGAAVAGTTAVSAQASSPGGVAAVQFRLDGADLGPRLSAAPYTFSWNTVQGPGDTHELTAVAWDVAGSSAVSAPVTVTVDNTPLQIREAGASGETQTAATISWATSRPADSRVEYGPTASYGEATPAEDALVTAHSASLASLTPGTTYHYQVRSRAPGGLEAASEDLVFLTAAAPPDVTPPTVVIMNPPTGAFVSGTVTVNVNATDNVGVASVQFLLDGNELGPPVTAAPFLFSWNTAGALDGAHALGATARDAAGNSATHVVSVTIANTPPTLGIPSVTGAAPNRADVTWTTDQRADSAADYGPTPAYGASTPVISALATGHGAALTGLTPGTLYHYRIKSKNAAGVLSVSGDYTFTTPGVAPAAGSAAAALPSAATDDTSVKAPQKFLTPASVDGVNDKAVFGPGAQEVWIVDARGRAVFHAASSGPGSPVSWDCRDGSGRIVPAGVYIARILTRDSRQVYQSFAVAK